MPGACRAGRGSDVVQRGDSKMLEAPLRIAVALPRPPSCNQVVAEQLETFLRRQQQRDRPVPQFV
jgi:hypothetical protein